jgi:hypothetical protein
MVRVRVRVRVRFKVRVSVRGYDQGTVRSKVRGGN